MSLFFSSEFFGGKLLELLAFSMVEMATVFELSGEDPIKVLELSKEEMLGKVLELFGEVVKLLELLEGEMTKTVDGVPFESNWAFRLPIESRIIDWPAPSVALRR